MEKAASHASRGHSEWSASATSRNVGCPGSFVLAATVQRFDVESEAAGWGTACHQIAERCLRTGGDAEALIGITEATKQHKFEVDDEMAETAQVYIDYVRRRIKEAGPGARHQPEQHFSLEKINPPFEAGGTADYTIYFPKEEMIEVIDLKGGRGVKVEVNENKQARSYALGALLELRGLRVKKLMSTIVQPRIQHKDSVIRSETYDIIELLEWTQELRSAMHKADEARKAYALIAGDLTRDNWSDKYLRTGEHCTFCPAAGLPCPAREKEALSACGVYFDDSMRLTLTNNPESLSIDRLAAVLDGADMVSDFIKSCRALAKALAEKGTKVGNYILTESVGHRKYTAPEKDVAALLRGLGVAEDKLWKKTIVTPAQVEKLLDAEGKAELAGITERPVTGRNLVRADKTERSEVKPTKHQHLTVLTD